MVLATLPSAPRSMLNLQRPLRCPSMQLVVVLIVVLRRTRHLRRPIQNLRLMAFFGASRPSMTKFTIKRASFILLNSIQRHSICFEKLPRVTPRQPTIVRTCAVMDWAWRAQPVTMNTAGVWNACATGNYLQIQSLRCLRSMVLKFNVHTTNRIALRKISRKPSNTTRAPSNLTIIRGPCSIWPICIENAESWTKPFHCTKERAWRSTRGAGRNWAIFTLRSASIAKLANATRRALNLAMLQLGGIWAFASRRVSV
mmetsp:Transcript_1763/g.6257  ORF Transcript_1763/g.6257 Transcript_1763/m.6257 type:complete len:256 (+) Transcript_1763:778-1545(+)